jgi:LacI family transcriptional regulator
VLRSDWIAYKIHPMVTIRDVARAAGVNASTVSRALRHDSSIPDKTVQRISQIASKMGYFKNPYLSTFMAERRRGGKGGDLGRLAYVTPFAEMGVKSRPYLSLPYESGKRRAAELGFNLELIQLGRRQDLVRANTLIGSQNIKGLIVAHVLPGLRDLDLDWHRLAVVSITAALRYPKVHTIMTDYFWDSSDAVERCLSLGYRRIGFFAPPRVGREISDLWFAAFLGRTSQERGRFPVIPPFMPVDMPDSGEPFRKWFLEHHPEVLIGVVIEKAQEWIEEMSLKIPEDVGFVHLGIPYRQSIRATGFLHPDGRIGASAVEHLIGLIQRGETGIHDAAGTTLFKSHWHAGNTLRTNPS